MIDEVKKIIEYGRGMFRDLLVIRRVSNNQKAIVRWSKQQEGVSYIVCRPLVRGAIDRYYHFVFDLLLPLSTIIEHTPTAIFYINDFGPLAKELPVFFGDRVRINKEPGRNVEQVVIGMNPNGLGVLTFNFDGLCKAAFKNKKTNKSTGRRRILLVERGGQSPGYLSSINNKPSGVFRRSIVNHRILEEVIRSQVSDQYEFENLILENLSVEQQIYYFRSSDLVIGQHGAGLANIIWMDNGSTVIEIGYKSRSHFEKISNSKKHNFLRYKNYDEDHISVDVDDFLAWLISNPSLKKFLK